MAKLDGETIVTERGRAQRQTLGDLLPKYGRLAIVTALVFTFLGFFARAYPVAELATHFKIFYLLGALFGALACGAVKVWKWTALAAALAVFHTAPLIPWYLPGPALQSDGAPLRLLVVNAMADEKGQGERIERFLGMLEGIDPQVVFLQEYDFVWQEALKPIRDAFPYRVEHPRIDNFGIALFSTLPLENAAVVDPAGISVPAIRADLFVNGRSLSLLNYHTIPPSPSGGAKDRNRQLSAIAPYSDEQEDLFIVAGDFNTTMWSPFYRDMVRDAGLVNTREGFGILPTWFTAFPGLALLPLDHCLVSPELGVRSCRRAPKFGSDHMALIIDLAVPLGKKPDPASPPVAQF